LATDRQNARSVRVSDVASARFFQGDRDSMRPGYVINIFGESVSRAKVVASVVEKFLSEDGRFASATLDDGTGAIRARVFAGELKIIEDVGVGDLVLLVGRMKNYNGENYVAPDFLRKLDDPNHETLFRLEVLSNISEKKKIVDDLRKARDQTSEEELKSYALEKYGLDADSLQEIVQSEGPRIDYKPMILDMIGMLDDGKGVEIGKLLEESKLDESMVESAINGLLASGDIYEPTAGRLKKV